MPRHECDSECDGRCSQKELRLKPSDIYYSQSMISAYFGRSTQHRFQLIGNTLDDLAKGTVKVDDIPFIRVCRLDGKWFTVDNRRLWIFRNLEEAGLCKTIRVLPCCAIDDGKFSTTNGGTSVEFIMMRSPGGTFYKKLGKSSW